MNLDNILLALHIFGTMLWIGGLFALTAFIEATVAEPDAAARGRLVVRMRQAALVPDIGATIAMLLGLHWLFKFKLYGAHYMHGKLALVALVIGLHGYLRVKSKRVKLGTDTTPPPVVVKPLLSLLAIGILVFVITKVPA